MTETQRFDRFTFVDRNYYPVCKESSTDLHSLIATIAQTAVDSDKLQQAIFSLQEKKFCNSVPVSHVK